MNEFGQGVVNINGEDFHPDLARISIFDRGFLFGDSIYEVTRSYAGKLLFLEEHLDRLWNSANLLSLEISLDREELTRRILSTYKKTNIENAYLRVIITRGEGAISLDPDASQGNNIVIIVKPQIQYPSEWYDKGVNFIVSKTVRNNPRSLNPNAKSGNYLNNILAFIEAKKANAYDAFMLNDQNYLTEGTTNNLWIIKQGQVKTPPLHVGILKGITRTIVLKACDKSQIPFSEDVFEVDELYQADECFITSSTKEVVPVVKVDDHLIGNGKPGSLTKRIHQLYKEMITDYLKKANY